jgi:hypothetical protein
MRPTEKERTIMEVAHGKQQTPCWVPASAIGGSKHDPDVPGIVLEARFSYEGNYLQCKVQVTVTKQGFGDQQIASTYVYPRPIQSYKLKKREIDTKER